MKKSMKSKEEIISRLSLEPEVADWVIKDRVINPKGNGNIPSRATEFFHWYKVYRKGFLINLIENHYEEIKKLVRKIGRARQKAHESMGEYWDGN